MSCDRRSDNGADRNGPVCTFGYGTKISKYIREQPNRYSYKLYILTEVKDFKIKANNINIGNIINDKKMGLDIHEKKNFYLGI